MKSMNIAASSELVSRLSSHRRVVALGDTDFTDVAAVVITAADSRSGILALLKRTGFHLPVFLYSEHAVELPAGVTAVINGNEQQWLELESAACQYEENLLPPFYDTLTQYVEMGNSTFACPGHQHGAFFKKHPAGRHFYDFFGENVFRADMCNADVKLGDLLIHEGSAKDAQKFAAKVFHADKTYFVLNGTSAANKVVTNALLTRGDLVLFDRNNHKSNHHGALIQAGHKAARALGYAYSVVLGSADYYPRFGYVPADMLGILPPFEVPRENFMACKLTSSAPAISGTIVYAKAFGLG